MVQGHYLEAEQLLNCDPSPWAQGDLADKLHWQDRPVPTAKGRMVQGHYLEAEQLLNCDPSPWAQGDLANAIYRLGGIYAMENRYQEAKRQYLKALEIQEKV